MPKVFDWEPIASGPSRFPSLCDEAIQSWLTKWLRRKDRLRVYEQVLRDGTEADVRHYVDRNEFARSSMSL